MHYLQVLGRLKPGVAIEQARADMTVVARGISAIAPDTNKGWGVTIEPLREALVDSDLRVTSLVLAGMVLFVVLMSCANIANLLLARGVERARELAVRVALGATKAQILRVVLTESLLLACLGGVAGLAIAWGAVRVAPAVLPRVTLPESIVLAFDARLTAFTVVLTVVPGVLAGLVPAWYAARAPIAATFGAGGRAATRRNSATRGGARRRPSGGRGAAHVRRGPPAEDADLAQQRGPWLPRAERPDHVRLPAPHALPDRRAAAAVLSGGGAGDRRATRGSRGLGRRESARGRLGHRSGLRDCRCSSRGRSPPAGRSLPDGRRPVFRDAWHPVAAGAALHRS